MAFIPVNFTVQAEFFYSMENSRMENILHYYVGHAPTENDCIEIAEQLNSMWVGGFNVLMSDKISLVGMKCFSIHEKDGPGTEFTVDPAVAGTASGDVAPANCAVQAIFYTGKRGRSNRGRIFIPGIPESVTTGSTIQTAHRTAWASTLESFRYFDIGELSCQLVVVSRYTDGAPRVAGQVSAVTEIGVGQYVASQRRRLPGRGA